MDPYKSCVGRRGCKEMRLGMSILLCALTISGCAVARIGAFTQAQELQAAGKCDEAIRRLDEMLSYGTPTRDQQSRANLLKAECYEAHEKHDQAIALYTYVVKKFPDTAAAYQAAAALAKYRSGEPVPETNGQLF